MAARVAEFIVPRMPARLGLKYQAPMPPSVRLARKLSLSLPPSRERPPLFMRPWAILLAVPQTESTSLSIPAKHGPSSPAACRQATLGASRLPMRHRPRAPEQHAMRRLRILLEALLTCLGFLFRRTAGRRGPS